MSLYATLKLAHVTCVVLSGAGFALRGALRVADSPLLATRAARIMPHVVDTLLLATAVSMAVLAGLWPTDHPWLAAKIVALFAYIGLGAAALRHPSPRGRVLAYVLALLVLAYIVAVARTRLAWPLEAFASVATSASLGSLAWPAASA